MLCPGLGLVERHVDGLVQAGAQTIDEPVRVALVLRLLLWHRDEQVGEDAVEVEAAVLAIIIIVACNNLPGFLTRGRSCAYSWQKRYGVQIPHFMRVCFHPSMALQHGGEI